MRAIVNISLTPQLNNLVNKTVSKGQYASKSEFFRHLIRTWANQPSPNSKSKTINK